MKVSIRDFQLRAGSYMDKLPIELTKYGRVVARVVEDSVEVKEDRKAEYTGGENVPEWATALPVTVEPTPSPEVIESLGRCQVVPGCGRFGVGMGKIWNEVIGEFVEAVACSKHLKNSQEEG